MVVHWHYKMSLIYYPAHYMFLDSLGRLNNQQTIHMYAQYIYVVINSETDIDTTMLSFRTVDKHICFPDDMLVKIHVLRAMR